MKRFVTTLPLVALLSLGTAAMAQDSGTAQTDGTATQQDSGGANGGAAKDLNMGKKVQDPSYIKETFGDWQIKCFSNETEDKSDDMCQMYQLLHEDSGNPVAEVSIYRLPDGNPAAAGATLVVPLGTLLPREVMMRVDDNPAKRYPYSFCTVVGCVARVGLAKEDVDMLKGGAVATLTIVPAQAPDKSVDIKMSLKGFTDAYNNASVLSN